MCIVNEGVSSEMWGIRRNMVPLIVFVIILGNSINSWVDGVHAYSGDRSDHGRIHDHDEPFPRRREGKSLHSSERDSELPIAVYRDGNLMPKRTGWELETPARDIIPQPMSLGIHERDDVSQTRVQLLDRERATTASTHQQQQEVEALLSFKGAVSADPLGWLTSWTTNDSTPCKWSGILCSSSHVIIVDLQNRHLVGDIDSAFHALGRLRFLERVNLCGNAFSGSLSTLSGFEHSLGNWSRVSHLNISHNFVTGNLPSQWDSLVSLESLDLSWNNLTGGIPPSIFNCSTLKLLNLENNFMAGPFPELVGRLYNLLVLNLGSILPDAEPYHLPSLGNSFTGSIPSSLSNCSALEFLVLQNNPLLGGVVPSALSQLKNLRRIDLSFCTFVGYIPAWFGNFTRLSSISLSYNKFGGHIPPDLGKIPELKYLSATSNNISGVIPDAIMNCTSLTELTLEENYITGAIPSTVGLLRSLFVLSVDSNSLTGVIPSSLGNCSKLTCLNLSYNKLMDAQRMPAWISSLTNLRVLALDQTNLHGPAPEELGRLPNITYMSFWNNNLTGKVPSSLGNCSSLQDLYISFNLFTGPLPPELGRLSNLTRFLCFQNSLSGPLPSLISNWSQLKVFDASNNLLDGAIGDQWGTLPKLCWLSLHGNYFGGDIPKNLGNVTAMLQLQLSSNRLGGEIPPSLGNLTNLGELWLRDNVIVGSIPPELAGASNLLHLDLSQNELQGYIPFRIGELHALEGLYLGVNKLIGTVPESLNNCSRLITLHLSHNGFSGRIPAEVISHIQALTYLNLSNNLFSGPWNPQLIQFGSIEELNISANNISGPFSIDTAGDSSDGDVVPSSASSWKSLVKLDISRNGLTGAIPASLGSLPFLTFFNASYNDFEGPVPDMGVFKSNLTEASFLGNPLLCGAILGRGRECEAPANLCHGFRCRRVWIPTAVSAALVAVAGVLLVMFLARRARIAVPPRNRRRISDVNVTFDPDLKILPEDIFRIIYPIDNSNVISTGSKSVVYKGQFPDGKIFAIKVLSDNSRADRIEGGRINVGSNQRRGRVLPEVQVMAGLRHRNILKVIGYFSDEETSALVLEYMPEGSLHRHLHVVGDGTCSMPWRTRFSIALGVAEGVKYLHHDFPEPLIHGDLKPANVLLDASLVPKISDFGLSKFANLDGGGQATASGICGTLGYIPPEYALGTVVSTKGDVYSFGVVLLELLTGRSPSSDSINGSGNDQGTEYRMWVVENYRHNSAALLDTTLQHGARNDRIVSEKLRLMFAVALLCTDERPQTRPSMSDVVTMLHQIEGGRLRLQDSESIEHLAVAI